MAVRLPEDLLHGERHPLPWAAHLLQRMERLRRKDHPLVVGLRLLLRHHQAVVRKCN